MKVSVNELRRMYPPRTSTAVTGWIPMSVFDAIESRLRPEMRVKGMRVHYRGPRLSNAGMFPDRASRTRRCDATHAVVYYNS